MFRYFDVFHDYVDAMLKFDEALMIDPNMHDALLGMANANSSYALLIPDTDEAKPYADKARDYISQALDGFDMNDLQRKSLDLQRKSQKFAVSFKRENPKKKSNNLKYGIFGWVIPAVAFVAWMWYAKSKMPVASTSSKMI